MNFLHKLKQTLSKYSTLIVIFISIGISITSLIYYFNLHLTLAYDDSQSHLNIARRVVDSLTPGLVQIGSTWLPLLHILELPLIWNTFMWHSGLAGSIVSMASFVLSCFFIFKIVHLLTKDKFAAFLGTAVFWANANIVYMQATPMFEPLLMVTALGTVYFLVKWIQTDKILDLLYSSFFAFLSTISRYDGWALLAAVIPYVFIYTWFYKKFKIAKGITIFYVTLAGFGVILWLLYNYLIFGSPTYFISNEFSAQAQQLILAANNSLFTKKNMLLSIEVYLAATVLTQGIIFTILATIGIVFYLIKTKLNLKFWAAFLLLVPLPFNIYALYKGQSVIWIPNFPPYFQTFFNIRYGLLMAPAIAVFVGYLAMKSWWRKIIIIAAIIVQVLMFYSLLPGKIYHLSFVTLRDTIASVNQPTLEATSWFSQNYKGGLVLISSASSESFIFNSGLDMNKFITEGTGHYWFESLKSPISHAEYIVMFNSFTDRVGKALKNNSELDKDYQLIYQNKTYFIFKKSTKSLSNAALNAQVSQPLWQIQSIDTMKTSRDEAKSFFTDQNNYKTRAVRELQLIKTLGANYVAIDTPYDKEFLPVLRFWANEAHSLGLHVWFRGNFSSWEGWFGYPKNMTINQHLEQTASFITSNSNLFEDGDSFTPAPEAENGGPWNPVKKEDFASYNAFLRKEYDVCRFSFADEGKKVNCNWLSMNADVANNVLDQQTVNYLGGLVTIDHYVKDTATMNKYIESIHYKLHANVLIGEFGAPLPSINGTMTDDQQAAFVTKIFDLLYQRNYILGINYWVITGGPTALTNGSLTPKKVTLNLEDYYKPNTLIGKVVDGNNRPISKAEVFYKNTKVLTDTNGNYTLHIPSGAQSVYIRYGALSTSFTLYLKVGGSTTYTTVLAPNVDETIKAVNPEDYNALDWLMKNVPQYYKKYFTLLKINVLKKI